MLFYDLFYVQQCLSKTFYEEFLSQQILANNIVSGPPCPFSFTIICTDTFTKSVHLSLKTFWAILSKIIKHTRLFPSIRVRKCCESKPFRHITINPRKLFRPPQWHFSEYICSQKYLDLFVCFTKISTVPFLFTYIVVYSIFLGRVFMLYMK